jgi:sugar lactone lactonase YvrE
VPIYQAESSASSPAIIEYMFTNPVPVEVRDARMFNDSACDAKGRIFSGSKTLRGQPFNENQLPGRIYKLENVSGQWKSEELPMGGMTVPNGIAFSPANDTMYVVGCTDDQYV